jgi:hypothetical protein
MHLKYLQLKIEELKHFQNKYKIKINQQLRKKQFAMFLIIKMKKQNILF